MIVVKKFMRSVLTIVLFGFLFVAIDFYRGKNIPHKPNIEGPQKTLEQGEVDLVQLSYQRPVLLYFWATWCAPCKTVTPSVEWLAKNYSVYTIAMNSGNDQELKAHLKQADIHFPVINDPYSRLGSSIGVGATPTVIILHQGRVSSATMGISTPIGLWLRLVLA